MKSEAIKVKKRMRDKSKLSSTLTGVAGEYFVAAELSHRGWVASITLRNIRGIDILVTNQDASHSVTIQCKSTQDKKKEWLLDKKCENYFSDKHFYVFVNLAGLSERPSFHVVPSEVVAKHIQYYHQLWLDTPGRKGQEHNDGKMRKYADPDNVYLEKWNLLGL